MSNFLTLGLGGSTGGLAGSPLQSVAGSSLAAQAGSQITTTRSLQTGTSGTASRDSQVADLSATTSAVNLLQQAAAAFDAPEPALPAAAPMPAPAKPADVPTDDHGVSNIVFADADVDGSLIH